MRIQKWLGIVAATTMLLGASAKADDWWDTRVRYDAGHDQLFNANEFSLDLFGTYQARQREFVDFPNTSIKGNRGQWGGGVGGNYFFCRWFGADLNTAFLADRQHFVDHVGGDLMARLPFDAAHLAPYVLGGGGHAFNPAAAWYADVGVGLEFRLNPKMGLFSDARFIWMDHETGNQAAIRFGLRTVF